MGHIAKNAAGWGAAWAILSECLQSKAKAADKAKVHWHTSRPCFPPRVPTLKCLAISKSVNNSEIIFRFKFWPQFSQFLTQIKLYIYLQTLMYIYLDLCTDKEFFLSNFETSHTQSIHHILLYIHFEMWSESEYGTA